MSRLPIRGRASFAAPLLCALFAIAPLAAQDEPASEPAFATYKLANGETVRGAILQTDGERIQMRVSIADGAGRATSWYDLSAFDGASQVHLKRDQLADTDVEGQLGIAEFAMEKGLLPEAIAELKRAFHMADHQPPGTFRHLKDRSLGLIERILVRACEVGRTRDARAGLSRFLTKRGAGLSDEEQQRLVDAVEGASQKHQDEAAAKRRATQDAKTQADVQKKIDKAAKLMKDGEEARRKGLTNSKNFGAATQEFEKAAKRFEQAIAEAEKIKKTYSNDEALGAEIDAAIANAKELWCDAVLATASMRLTRGQFNPAMADVNKVLADDPQNGEALAMRARIEVAANDWGNGRLW